MPGPGRPSNAAKEAAAAEAARAAESEKDLVTDEEITTTTPTSDADEAARLRAEIEQLRKELTTVKDKQAGKVGKPEVDKDGNFVIHFVNNGLTLLGKIWYTGQELEFNVNSQAYKDTCDINGFSVLELRNNPRAQERVLRKEFFREGRWTGKSYADIEFERLKALAQDEDIELPTKDDLKRLDEQERKRLRQAEALTPLRGAPRPRDY